ncbi:hypothetical protein LCGC14_0688650 [marine sediment metagenome]|uniref:Response regulatory domain-containing protein n=1 Tax=marine sediment metagenome TaxID=412755 RepID=A0A0F9TU44_9ZZZZ|nr:response regulator [Candidatus Aminicenantes bacterium]HEB34757.1 response regulator [Candidatus Aminicenantes bacterium]
MSKKIRILVVDDDRRMVKTLVDILNVKGCKAEGANSGYEAQEKLAERNFDCVLADLKMPQMNGVELHRAIKATQPNLPVVLMTAYFTDQLVEEGLEDGAIASLTKPLDINLLLSFFSFLRKERSMVIVDDDQKFCRTLGDILKARGFKVIQVTDPHDVMGKMKPDGQVVLLDMKLNKISGLEVLKQLRKQHPPLPVILVTGYRAEMEQAIEAALKINAYTCLYKPFKIEKLLQVLTEIHHRELGRVLGRPVRMGG